MPKRELFEVEPQRRGWAPTQPGRSRTDARYEHSSGWQLRHCGHTTALRPYYAISPDGHEVFDRDGGGWRTVDAAKHDLYHSYGVQP